MQYIYMYMYILRYVGINRIVHVLNDIVGTDYCKKKKISKLKIVQKEYIDFYLLISFLNSPVYVTRFFHCNKLHCTLASSFLISLEKSNCSVV